MPRVNDKRLKALHDRNILNRDFNSANIFMQVEGVIKLGDFNVSKLRKIMECYKLKLELPTMTVWKFGKTSPMTIKVKYGL